jgi:hypothetical protein
MIKSRMRWEGHAARVRETRNAYRILVGKPEGKRPLGSPRRRWVDNSQIDLREMGWDGIDWIDLAQDRDHTSDKAQQHFTRKTGRKLSSVS